jgi:hypothetical protein
MQENLDINLILLQLVKYTAEVPCLLFQKEKIVLFSVKLSMTTLGIRKIYTSSS